MYTLVLASQKGGSGKTTLSGHLSVEAERAGAGPVALIDTDPQGSLAEWWNARESKTPVFVKVGSMELEDALTELRSAGIKIAIVDTPPAITGAISKVVSCADLVLVPTRPGPHDLRAVGATVDIAERAGKPLVFVINDATARARITSDAAVALSQHGTVAPVTLHHRVDYAASMVDGRTVGEIIANSKSAEEIATLWTYVFDRLKKVQNDANVVADIRPRLLTAIRPSLVVPDELYAKSEDVVTTPAVDSSVLGSPALNSPALHSPAFNSHGINSDQTNEGLEENLSTVDESQFNAGPPNASVGESLAAEDYNGPERRNGAERRVEKLSGAKFGIIERRNNNPFGRRRSDRAI